MSFLLLLIAVIVQAIVLLAWAVPFALPRVEAWQAFAFLMFFCSFLPIAFGAFPWRRGP